MKTLALKIDVDTYRGTRDGVPALLNLLAAHNLRATFLFSLGPDNTGRAIRRVFRRGFLAKVQRTSVLSHYGLKTLLYGVLLPGPHIAGKLAGLMRRVHEAGHEVGIHCYDHVRWQDNVASSDRAWTQREMMLAHDAFVEALGIEPTTIGAAGWQINPDVIELEQSMGFHYASDVRGSAPFVPEFQGRLSSCVQLPTTLPTLDEMLGVDGVSESNLAHSLLRITEDASTCQVYTAHAELEGMKMLPVMEALIPGWQSQGFILGTLADSYAALNVARLPRKQIVWAQLPGRSGMLACEGEELPSNCESGGVGQ